MMNTLRQLVEKNKNQFSLDDVLEGSDTLFSRIDGVLALLKGDAPEKVDEAVRSLFQEAFDSLDQKTQEYSLDNLSEEDQADFDALSEEQQENLRQRSEEVLAEISNQKQEVESLITNIIGISTRARDLVVDNLKYFIVLRAKCQRVYYNALVEEGFSPEEAMQIVTTTGRQSEIVSVLDKIRVQLSK